MDSMIGLAAINAYADTHRLVDFDKILLRHIVFTMVGLLYSQVSGITTYVIRQFEQ